MDQVFIQIKFTENTEVGTYSDAIYMTQEEYAAKSKADIDALKKVRVDAFVDAVKNPVVEVQTKEEIKEDLLETADSLQKQLDIINDKIEDIESSENTKVK